MKAPAQGSARKPIMGGAVTKKPSRRTRLDPDTRRRSIVQAASEVMLGHDPMEVSIELVAEAAGVSRALIYNYFGDRGGLLAAV